MTKKLFFLAAAAVLLAGCSALEQTGQDETSAKDAPQAVGFGAYLNQGVSTKAGPGGILTTAGDNALQTVGFGVFAYYSNGGLYNESTSKPDFMYNEKVTYDTDHWTYSPVKYWPNEYGASAISEETDRLSFFAYAPWVEVTKTTGIPTGSAESGIIALSRNSAAGDPFVKYAVAFSPKSSVDLCWGVAASNFTSSADPSNENAVKAGWPYIDLWKPQIGEPGYINMNFKHALAAVNFTIDAWVDKNANDDPVATPSKVYVRSVTFEGFASKGTLNLNSSNTSNETEVAPNWSGSSLGTKLDSSPITVFDGRRDGKEALYEATNEKPANLNPLILQSNAYVPGAIDENYQYTSATNASGGVTETAVNLFDVSDWTYADPSNPTAEEIAAALAAPIFVIPTDETLKVTIVYDVETPDATVTSFLSDGATHGTVVENKITKTIAINTTPVSLKAGTSYKVALHLGLTSVKFDASVTAWPASTDAAEDMPANKE